MYTFGLYTYILAIPSDLDALKSNICTWINDNVFKSQILKKEDIDNAHKLKTDTAIIVSFVKISVVNAILKDCSNLTNLNAQRREENKKSVEIRRHFEPLHQAEFKYLQQVKKYLIEEKIVESTKDVFVLAARGRQISPSIRIRLPNHERADILSLAQVQERYMKNTPIGLFQMPDL